MGSLVAANRALFGMKIERVLSAMREAPRILPAACGGRKLGAK